MKIGELVNGTIKIDIGDLFSELTEDELKEVAEAYSWRDPAYKVLIKNLQTDYASHNINPDLYELRKAMIITPYEYPWQSMKFDIVECIRDTVHQIIKENVELKIQLRWAEQARPKLYNFVKSKFGNDVAYYVNSKMVDLEMKGGEDKYAHTVAYDSAVRSEHDAELKDLVDMWFEELYERFTRVAQDTKKE